MTKLVLIDGNAIAHRAYHAMPPFKTPDGEPIGAVQGFVNILLRLLDDLKPTHLAVCFDRKEKTFRKKAFDKYQAHRPETDKELSSQFGKIREVLETMQISTFDKKGFEADDVIGTIAKKAKVENVIIVTGDKDQLQLVDEKINVYMPVKGISNSVLLDKKGVYGMLGVYPDRVVDLKALMGDSSDNYPGIYGIGPKSATKLLSKFGSYKQIFKNIKQVDKKMKNKLVEGKKDGDISYKLAQIVTDLKVKFSLSDLGTWNVANPKVIDLFKSYGFRTLTRRVEEMSKKATSIKEKLTLEDVKKTVVYIAKKLKGKQYAIRGTASLILQGIEMNVDDVDVVCDKKTALYCNEAFDWVVEKVSLKDSDKFKSYFGKFNLDGVSVEVMGEWEIKTGKKLKKWTAAKDDVTSLKIDGEKVAVTKVETELSMFSAMGRWSAYHKIKKHLDEQNQQSLF